LWDVARKEERRRFQGHTDEVWAVGWSPDGQALVTGGRGGSVRYWDPASKPRLPYAVLPKPGFLCGLGLLPDSKTFLALTRPEGSVARWEARWNAPSVQKVEELQILGSNHTALDLSRDGHWLALGDLTGNVRFWDFPARRMVTKLVAPGPQVWAVGFSPRGSFLNCGAFSTNGSIAATFWDVTTWREIRLPAASSNPVSSVGFSPDERTVAIGYTDGTAAWWNLANGQRRDVFPSRSACSVRVAFAPDGTLFATAGLTGLLTVYDVASPTTPRPFTSAHRNTLGTPAFSTDSRRLMIPGMYAKGLIKVWDVETGRDVATLPGEQGWFVLIRFSPDGNTLFAGSTEGRTLLWPAPSWAEIEAFEKRHKTP
jgi:WD40 repeat protein